MRRRTKTTDSVPSLFPEGPPKIWETKGIFSDHYIKTKLKASSLWLKEEEVKPLYEFCHDLWAKRAVTFAKADEQFTRQELLEKILPRLGFAYLRDPSMPVSAGRKVPDYLLFANEETKESVLSKDKETQYAAAITVLEAKKVNLPLDRASEKETPGRFPHQQIRDYLQEATDIQGKPYFNWAILTSGNLWRLYCRNARPNDYFEFDLEKSLTSFDDFMMFAALFRAQAFVKNGEGRCLLDDLRDEALQFQARLEDDLRKRVFNILENLANGFYRRAENKITNNDLNELYQNCLIFLYRLLFILYAEGRALLPVKSHGVGSNKNYRERHSLQRLIPRLKSYQEFTSEELTDLYDELLRLFHLINGDRPSVNRECNVPLYNGRLFDSEKYPEIDQWRIGEKILGDVLRGLIFSTIPERAGEQKAFSFGETIDYADLEVRQLGSIYEGLLENHLALKNGSLLLVGDKAERKATGTYYTPDYIVQYIVKNTVGPLCDEIEKIPEVQKAIAENKRDSSFANAVLKLNILDPAMGSGHFLVRATEFLADRILNHRTTALQIEKVSPGLSHEQTEIAYWRRRVVESCIYGVDLNPLAVELAKLSLWLTCISSDQPLNFLDHHLRPGNSLISAKLSDLGSFPTKKRTEQIPISFGPDLPQAVSEAIMTLHKIEETESKDIAIIKNKESRWYEEVWVRLESYRMVADAWTATFFGLDMSEGDYNAWAKRLISKPETRTKNSTEITERFDKCGKSVSEIAKRKMLFHWELEFPEVFFNDDGSPKENPGFDAVIGNPPYVMELRENKVLFRELSKSPIGQKYYEAKMDIFYFFIEHAIDLLKQDGVLGFIVQEYWVSRTHASKLREKIFKDTTPRIFVNFKGFQIFKDATGQHNMIIVLDKSKTKDKSLILSLKDADAKEEVVAKALASELQNQTTFEISERDVSKIYSLKTDKVYLGDALVLDSQLRLAANSFNLDSEEIQQGLVTPQHFLTSAAFSKFFTSTKHKPGEGIFVFSIDEFRQFDWTKHEQEVLKPFHYAEEIDKFSYTPDVNHYLIYTSNECVKNLKEKPSYYPNIIAHLDKYQKVITSDNKPYGIHRARQSEWFEDPQKIIGVRKTKYPKFVVVPSPYYMDQSVFIIRLIAHKKYSPNYLCVLLNSKVAHSWFYQQKRQGEQLQIDKEVLLHFPVHNISFITPEDKRKLIFDQAKSLYERHLKANNHDVILLFIQERLTVKPDESDIIHDLLSYLAEQMIMMNMEKQRLIPDFLNWLEKEIIQGSIEDLKNKTKIKEFYANSFDTLVDVLKQNHVLPETIGFGDDRHNKLEKAFNDTMAILSPLVDKILKTDSLMDQIVYRLYGLTDEEIKIVEQSLKG